LNNSTAPAPTIQNNLTAAFYQWYTKQFCSHPLAELDPTQARHVKVLYEKKITLQQVVLNEGASHKVQVPPIAPSYDIQIPVAQGPYNTFGFTDSSIGHNQHVKISIPLKKMCTFDWQKSESDPGFLVGQANNQSTYVSQLGETRGNIRFKDRIYLTIRALNPVLTPATFNANVDTTPSFDMKIRNNWVKFSN
jgi:hypothetical protein